MFGLLSFVLKALPGFAETVGNLLIKAKETEASRQGAEDARGADLALQYLQTIADTNKAKAESQTERQVLFGLLAFASPAGLIWWAACLDSIPFRIPFFMDAVHVVGSWRVAIPPAFVDDFHMIIQSFFIAAPSVAAVALLAKAFRR